MGHPQGPGEMGLCQTHEIQRGQVQGPAMGWHNPKHKHRLDKEWMEISPGERDLGTLMDEKLDVTQPCELAVAMAGLLWEPAEPSMPPVLGQLWDTCVTQLSLLHHGQGWLQLCRLELVFSYKPLQTSLGMSVAHSKRCFKTLLCFKTFDLPVSSAS